MGKFVMVIQNRKENVHLKNNIICYDKQIYTKDVT